MKNQNFSKKLYRLHRGARGRSKRQAVEIKRKRKQLGVKHERWPLLIKEPKQIGDVAKIWVTDTSKPTNDSFSAPNVVALSFRSKHYKRMSDRPWDILHICRPEVMNKRFDVWQRDLTHFREEMLGLECRNLFTKHSCNHPGPAGLFPRWDLQSARSRSACSCSFACTPMNQTLSQLRKGPPVTQWCQTLVDRINTSVERSM